MLINAVRIIAIPGVVVVVINTGEHEVTVAAHTIDAAVIISVTAVMATASRGLGVSTLIGAGRPIAIPVRRIVVINICEDVVVVVVVGRNALIVGIAVVIPNAAARGSAAGWLVCMIPTGGTVAVAVTTRPVIYQLRVRFTGVLRPPRYILALGRGSSLVDRSTLVRSEGALILTTIHYQRQGEHAGSNAHNCKLLWSHTCKQKPTNTQIV
jgi:hypothetical protein